VSSPDLRSPLQGYLVALDLLQRSKAAGENTAQVAATAASAEVIAERLLTMGVSRRELDAIARGGVVPPAIRITAPASGLAASQRQPSGRRRGRNRLAQLRNGIARLHAAFLAGRSAPAGDAGQ